MLPKECRNKNIVKLIEPYINGWDVYKLNKFYKAVDTTTYEELCEQIDYNNDNQAKVLVEILGDSLREEMERC